MENTLSSSHIDIISSDTTGLVKGLQHALPLSSINNDMTLVKLNA